MYPSNIREISIHAPAKGATKSENSQPCYHSHFNPRSREGSDAASTFAFTDLRLISIHAPAKGATLPCTGSVILCQISIHAPAKGATHRIRDLQRKDRFQSTLPRRERHRLHLIKRSDMNFNPRSREGSDVAALAICDANTNFNPRSREGSDFV